MMNPIQNISLPPVVPGSFPSASAGLEQGGETSFKDFLLRSLSEVNQAQQDADRAVEQLFTGGDVNPAEVLTAVQKADISFRMMMQIRNKVMQAYQEIKDIRI